MDRWIVRERVSERERRGEGKEGIGELVPIVVPKPLQRG